MCKCFRIWTFVWKNWYSDEYVVIGPLFIPPPFEKEGAYCFSLVSLSVIGFGVLLFAQMFVRPNVVCSIFLAKRYPLSIFDPFAWSCQAWYIGCTKGVDYPYWFWGRMIKGRSKFWSLKKCCLLNISWPLCLKVAKLSRVDTNRE